MLKARGKTSHLGKTARRTEKLLLQRTPFERDAGCRGNRAVLAPCPEAGGQALLAVLPAKFGVYPGQGGLRENWSIKLLNMYVHHKLPKLRAKSLWGARASIRPQRRSLPLVNTIINSSAPPQKFLPTSRALSETMNTTPQALNYADTHFAISTMPEHTKSFNRKTCKSFCGSRPSDIKILQPLSLFTHIHPTENLSAYRFPLG